MRSKARSHLRSHPVITGPDRLEPSAQAQARLSPGQGCPDLAWGPFAQPDLRHRRLLHLLARPPLQADGALRNAALRRSSEPGDGFPSREHQPTGSDW